MSHDFKGVLRPGEDGRGHGHPSPVRVEDMSNPGMPTWVSQYKRNYGCTICLLALSGRFHNAKSNE